ncbi:4-hydroxythreonine-4-phosphate dehydrogenase PdxA [Microbacterium sp. cx-59]|uniref:4-hydroxythreonine-4-phosphate dehydrogenase PdxA n=1 Tax=Microbacterium sp. cx-59 TaxID=2891207 RepID=UPI001E5D417F|nr:4-hydroxythreonine-4-phosphate dehydrogenase PdxA [Microbacterium sp. cx-59]MCC4908895.1 4-hydroxythreonine-4-phosphate dehydrogenase PdxA [Microbacterium sp. cx-59]
MKPFAITMGDPKGVGPEIVVKTIADAARTAAVVVIGDAGVLREANRITGTGLVVREIAHPSEVTESPGVLEVIPVTEIDPGTGWGRLDAEAGRASYDYVARAVSLAIAGEVSGIITAPVNKEALRLGGIHHIGHTEILAELAGVSEYAMMMANRELRIVLVTVHESLRSALDNITRDSVWTTIRLASDALIAAGFTRPRIAVAGVNPHAGENGLMGSEEIEIIAPVVAACRDAGMDVSGPFPADTVFMRARRGEFDVVIAQYHDQGLIPVKYLGIELGVNITLGLPFIRTSVDHGTAFDLAGKGLADHASLLEALHYAEQMAGAAGAHR